MNKKNKIGEKIKIKAGLYEVVKPDRDATEFIARSAMMGYFVISFKMDFVEQEAMVIDENGRVMLAGGTIIKL